MQLLQVRIIHNIVALVDNIRCINFSYIGFVLLVIENDDGFKSWRECHFTTTIHNNLK